MTENANPDAVDAPPAVPMVTCTLCNSEVPGASAYLVNEQLSCADCVAKVRAELAMQEPTASGLAAAVAGGLAGALAGAAVWAGVAMATDLEVGYVAILVGFLAGLGVKLGARKQRGVVLQCIAAGLAVVGLLAAKYMVFAYVAVKVGRENGVDLSYLDTRFLSVFPEVLGETINGFDALFLVLALVAAYRVPKANAIAIHKA